MHDDGGVTWLELEHYPGMTESVLCELAEQAMARWSLLSAVIVHRVVFRVVFVATAPAQRWSASD